MRTAGKRDRNLVESRLSRDAILSRVWIETAVLPAYAAVVSNVLNAASVMSAHRTHHQMRSDIDDALAQRIEHTSTSPYISWSGIRFFSHFG